MAKQDGSAVEVHEAPTAAPGTAVISSDRVENPGFPPHRPRVSDLDPAKEKQNERRVTWWFWASIVGSLAAVVLYVVIPFEQGNHGAIQLHTMLFGVAIALGLFGIGFGAVHWSKSLMDGHDVVEERHPVRGTEDTRGRAQEIFSIANKESGFTRRKLLRNSLIGALAVSPLPAVVLMRDLAPAEDPTILLRHTMWDTGVHLTRDPDGTRIKASDVTIGSVFHVIPEGLRDSGHWIEEKAKAVVLLMRLKPEDLNVSEGREDWNYQGIVAYSKICTHVGCPVALYEQHTHHVLCPCHQSQFDIKNEAEVIFGPAKRPLPQLPITVDAEGYLVARSDFQEPIGPSYWERAL